MLAAVLTGLGGAGQLEIRDDLPVPVPAAGEVLVRVTAAAVNNTDINTRTGWYSRSQAGTHDSAWTGAAFQLPRIQGADACGYIAAVGAGIAVARIGERVLIDPVLRGAAGHAGPCGYLGADRDGAFAQFTTVPAANAFTVHSAYTDAELASFPCSYLAAENMVSRAAIAHGEQVLISGASGGVGSAAIQLALRRGAVVTALSSTTKAAALRALGASRVLMRADELVTRLGQESVDAVIDSVGGSQFPAFLQLLRRGGRYAVAGAIGGAMVELDLRTLYLKDLRLMGCTIPEPGTFARLLGYIERQEINPIVSATYALRDIHLAQQEFLRKQHVGKILLLLP